MIKVIKGDLINLAKKGEFDTIMHGCNCFANMGGGIAYLVAKNFPEAEQADSKTLKGDIDKLGKFSMALVNNDKLDIINIYSQYFYGFRNEKPPIDYNALENSLKSLNLKEQKIGIPLIGYGLAGGNLIPILEIFFNELDKHDTTIVVYEKERNADMLIEVINDFFRLKRKQVNNNF